MLASSANLTALAQQPMTEAQPIGYNCLSREVFTPAKQAWCDRWYRLQAATLIVPKTLDPQPEFTTVTLAQGRYRREDGQFFVELVNQQGWMTFGDLNGDGKQDAAILFGVALDPDGRAVGTYLTAVLDIDGEARALTPIKLGECILLNGPISIENNQIVLPWLTQTEAMDRTFVIDGSTLKEVSRPRC